MNKITSAQNPLYKSWKKLQRRKERHKQQMMLIEGAHLLQEAVVSGLTIHAWLTTEQYVATLQAQSWFQAERAPLYLLAPALFTALAETQSPQGMIAVVSLPHWSAEALLTGKTQLLLDEVQDPGNLGTMIRTAEAAGAAGIWLGHGCVDPTNSKVVRAAMGSTFRLPIVQTDLAEWLPRIQQQGVQVISTSPRATSNCFAFDYADRVAFLLGNEARGVAAELATMVKHHVQLPMWGKTESLNVSVTAAVLLYERARQQLLACNDA